MAEHKYKVGDRVRIIGNGGYEALAQDEHAGAITVLPEEGSDLYYVTLDPHPDVFDRDYWLFFPREMKAEPPMNTESKADLEERIAALEAAVLSCDDCGGPLDDYNGVASDQGEWFDITNYISKDGIHLRAPLIHGEPVTATSISVGSFTAAAPVKNLEYWMDEVHEVNEANGWYDEDRSFGDDIALLHSEVSEAFEGYRNGDWTNVHEELADVFIRLVDTAYRYDVNLEAEVEAKMTKNRARGYKHGNKVV